MIRQDPLTRLLASLSIILAIATCGCAGLGRFARKKAAADPEPVATNPASVGSEVAPASFESACPGGCAQPGGYLGQGPVFSTMDGVSSPAAAVTQLRQLSAENKRLTAENGDMKQRLGELQSELIDARQSLLATQQECQAARNDLTATRTQLEQCQRLMEKTLERFQAAEKEHLGALDSAIESVRTVVDHQRHEEEEPTTGDANSSRRATMVSG